MGVLFGCDSVIFFTLYHNFLLLARTCASFPKDFSLFWIGFDLPEDVSRNLLLRVALFFPLNIVHVCPVHLWGFTSFMSIKAGVAVFRILVNLFAFQKSKRIIRSLITPLFKFTVCVL